jgi:hypothetical protein
MKTPAALIIVTLLLTSQPAEAQCPELAFLQGTPSDNFGWDVALEGDTAVVGARYDHTAGNRAGAVYVYARTPGGWVEEAKLIAGDPSSDLRLGQSVTLEGDTLAAAATNAAYVFTRSGTSWTQRAKLAANGSGGVYPGGSIALDGDTLLIGAESDSSVVPVGGAAYVYRGAGSTWQLEATLRASDQAGWDNFGASVDLEAGLAVIGARQDDTAGGANSGSLYVFERAGTTWTETAHLYGSAEMNGAFLGTSVNVEGNTIVAGAPHHGGINSYRGTAYVFHRSGNVWTEQAHLVRGVISNGDRFGHHVSLVGDTVAIGAPHDTFGADAGRVHVFRRSGTTWSEGSWFTGSLVDGNDWFGGAVSLTASGEVLVGAYLDEGVAGFGGAAYVSFLPAPTASYCSAGVSASGCQATLSTSGVASASAPSGFDLVAANVEGAKDGIFFFGTNGRQANPWGNGTSFQCVVPPVKRGGLLTASGTSGLCDGAFTQDLNARWTALPTQNPGAGAIVQAQLWYRDPLNTSNQTTSFSDAIEFGLCP